MLGGSWSLNHIKGCFCTNPMLPHHHVDHLHKNPSVSVAFEGLEHRKQKISYGMSNKGSKISSKRGMQWVDHHLEKLTLEN
jgi:hypothetical protein